MLGTDGAHQTILGNKNTQDMLSNEWKRKKRIYMMQMCELVSDFIAQTLLFEGSGSSWH